MNTAPSPSSWRKVLKPILGIGIVAAVALLLYVAWDAISDSKTNRQAFVLYTVTEADLPIVVTERGSLESQVETTIRCQVENSSYDRSSSGTQIIFIVSNGSAVKGPTKLMQDWFTFQGDLLVELDSAAISDRLDTQVLDYDRSTSQLIQTESKRKNQLSQNRTAKEEAELRLDLAKLELKMYQDDDNGTFMLAMGKIEREIKEAENTILESLAALELQKTEKAGIEALFRLGYRGRSDLDSSKFEFLRAEDRLATSRFSLIDSEANKSRLRTYEHKMQVKTLEGALNTAGRNLEQAIEDNKAKMQQADASMEEAAKAVVKEKERLEKLTRQLVYCMIRAPHDGMAVYARENSRYSSGSEIAEGVTVRERQRLLSLPDTSLMRVKTQVHEAVLDQVRIGLPVIVKIDAFPNRTYKGRVMQVAVVPSSSYYTTVKTYECTVDIEEEVEQLKPGMTAVVDIHIERLKDILAVPVQAVVQIERDTWCYVQTEHGVERFDIELGRTNDKFVEVKKGLESGWRVILNPMSIIKETEKTKIAPDAGVGETPEIPPVSAATEDKGKKGRSGAAKKGAGAGQSGGAGRTGGGRGAGVGGSNRRPGGGGRPRGGAGN